MKNRWLGGIVVVLFLILILVSVIFGRQVKNLSTFISATPVQLPKITSLTKNQDYPRVSIVAENLEIPWGLAFLPDNSILFTERPGRVKLIKSDGTLVANPILKISDVYVNGEGGLLGIAIDPKFKSNNFVYLYYSYSGKGRMLNRVVRYKFNNNSLSDQKVIVDGIPGNSNHDGGRIKFGPDGYLYITTGDSQDPSLAQDKSSIAGKILRVSSDGKSVVGNPFKDLIYSYGHRNPQGLAWDDKGRLWATEHGRSLPSGYDELNLIEKGNNYGWPVIQGDERKAGMIPPIINSGADTTWAPAGMAYFKGSLFFGGLKGEGLYEVVINNGDVTLKKHLDQEFGRIRDVVLGPDNMLYITTSNRDGRGSPETNDDKILRVNPAKL